MTTLSFSPAPIDEPPRPWRRHATRAVVAGALAVGLLTAGGGTFSRWYESQPLTGDTISSGQLSMTPATTTRWNDQNGPIDPASYRMVPGDTVTFATDTTITAVGDNLRGTLGVDHSRLVVADPPGAAGLNVSMVVSGLTDTNGTDGYTVVGQKGATVNDNGRKATVTITIVWPSTRPDGTPWGNGPGSGEASSVDLSTVRLVLSQNV